MRLSDVTFILYQPVSLNNRFSSPNKVFDAIHTETYFITSYSPLSHAIVSRYPVGEIIEKVTPGNLANQLKNALEQTSRLGNSSYEEVKKKYSWEEESRKLNRIIPDMLA